MAGAAGKLTVALAEAVHISAVSIDHIAPGNAPRRPGSALPGGAAASAVEVEAAAARATAPRRMSVYGLTHDGGPATPLGSFEYDAAGAVTQTFVLREPAASPLPAFSHVQLAIESNYGNPALTCLYRFRVHGTPAAAATAA